jgi:Tfp pilus assembly protein PilO
MYFIPRNNALYNYIAHTDTKRRYIATLFVLAVSTVICFYGLYRPLVAHIIMYKIERARLQKQYEESGDLEKSNKNLLTIIHTNKKTIDEYAVTDEARHEVCSQRMQFVFDTVAQAGLTLTAYGSCKEKDKKWYVKDSAHCQMTGLIESLIVFLKTIKDSGQIITLSHLMISRLSAGVSVEALAKSGALAKEGIKDNLFQLSCDVGIITVKK